MNGWMDEAKRDPEETLPEQAFFVTTEKSHQENTSPAPPSVFPPGSQPAPSTWGDKDRAQPPARLPARPHLLLHQQLVSISFGRISFGREQQGRQ